MTEMKAGKRYKRIDVSPNIECVCVFTDEDGALIKWSGGVGAYWPDTSFKWIVEIPSEKWVSLWWTDKHKTNVSTSSAFYDSEAQADGIGRFTASDLYIKSVRVV